MAARVWIFALIIAALTTLPYLVGWAAAGDDWVFNGFTIGAEDGNAYLGKMRIGARGEWEFYLFYSPEKTDSAFGLYLPYIAAGHLVGLFVNENTPELANALAIAFQVFRIFASVVLVLAIYAFVAEFIRAPQTRWLALILSTLGAGLGWLLVLTGQGKLLGTQPVEFYIPEGFSFLVIFALPHVAVARAAILFGLIFLFRSLDNQRWQEAALAGILWNLVGLMVTFYLPVIYAVLGAWGVALWVKKRQFPLQFALLGGLAAALTAPLFLYNIWLFSANDAFARWSSQNYLPSPHPIHYLFGYGLLAVLAVAGGRWAWKKGTEKHLLLISWVLLVPILVYLPINVQRRLLEAFFIPLVILAVVGLKLVARHTKPFKRAQLVVLVALLPSMLLLWVGSIFTLTTPDFPAFHPRAETNAMDWLAKYAEADSVVMGAFDTGNYLPARTNLRPFLGHGPETLDSDDKSELVEKFYRGELSPAEIQQLFSDFNIQYVMFGPLERKIKGDWNSDLALIYDQDNYQIYEVK